MDISCLTCQHLLIEKSDKVKKLLCKAYPKGIPIQIISGDHWHDHLFGDEKAKVFYDPITEEEFTRRQKEVDKETGTIFTLSPKTKRLLLKSIFFDHQELLDVYLKFYQDARSKNSAIPHEVAMIKFRELYDETPTGWVKK